MANPNTLQSREAQLREGQSAFTKIFGLRDCFQEQLPSKPYPKILHMTGGMIQLVKYPTVKDGPAEVVVAEISNNSSHLTLYDDGRILVNGYDDVQSLDPDMYTQAILSVEKCIADVIREQEEVVAEKKERVRKALGGFLGK